MELEKDISKKINHNLALKIMDDEVSKKAVGLFKEKNIIKVIDVNKETKVSYIISTLLNLINRWREIRIIFIDIKK